MDINIDLVQSVFSNKSEQKKLKQIKESVIKKIEEAGELDLFNKEEIEKQIEVVIKEDKKSGDASILRYNKNHSYSIRPIKKAIGKNKLEIPTLYLGAAGELAVLSELVFRGYNANRMMIDDGIDIVAMKNNIYTYIQVKTSVINDDRINWGIKRESFERYASLPNMTYILVARYKDGKDYRNIFFVLPVDAIRQGGYENWIMFSEENINIKVKFDPRTREPIFYDDKERGGGFYLNNF